VPTAGCSVTDGEDTNESATPVVDSSGLNSYGLGPVQVTCSYTDGGGLTETASATYSIVDTTNPVLDLPANITREATSSAGAEVDFSADVSATDELYGSVDVTCNPPSGTFALGTTTVNCSATDGSGNTAEGSFTVTVRDTTGPALDLPQDITREVTGPSGATGNFTATANDLVDGSRPISCDPASGSTFSAGTTTVNCSSSDSRGNTSNGSFTVTVNYAWTGFFQPVDNAGVFNKVKIGSTVPVKFSLGGNQGLSIFFSSAYPQVSKPITCGVNPAVDTLEEYAPTGTNSGLKYDATANQYIYNWKTDGYKAGECRSLIVKLADGSVKTANFTFFK
jgi:HYR domain